MKIPKFNYSLAAKTAYLTEGNYIATSLDGILKIINKAVLLDNGKILLEGYMQQSENIVTSITTIDERKKILEYLEAANISGSNKSEIAALLARLDFIEINLSKSRR
ncbi:hypothetical protein [Fusobacterium sp. PH5-44]|uniref:hypothetical protein n=1 Tax=unclassified Fusobacterium TaxID=2648384 RepID=UPI003D1C6F06